MARAMGTNAYGKEPRRGERTLSRGFTHRRARRAFLRPYGAGASLGWSHRAYALGYFLVPLTGLRTAHTRLARREELGIKAQTGVENVETPGPGLFSSAPNGASNRPRTRLARREELGIKAQTRVENVETPESELRSDAQGVAVCHGSLKRIRFRIHQIGR